MGREELKRVQEAAKKSTLFRFAKLHISGTMQAKSSRIPMDEIETQSKKIFPVHRIIGRYEIQGTVTCIPAPPPGILTALAQLAVEQYVEEVLHNRIVEDLFVDN